MVVLSGWLPSPGDYPDALGDSLRENAERLPVFFAHGDSDEIIKLEWARESHQQLEEVCFKKSVLADSGFWSRFDLASEACHHLEHLGVPSSPC